MPAATALTPVRHSRRGRAFWAVFLPPFSWMAVFYLVPLAVLLSLAFQRHEYVNVIHEFTIKNSDFGIENSWHEFLIPNS